MNLKSTIIRQYINDNFNVIYSLSNLCPTYLLGGAIRDLILDKIPKDLDFVCLTSKETIEDFVKKNHLKYEKNKLGGYKIHFKNITIDLWNTNDLFSAIEYNLDGLFYDIKNDYFIPFGYYNALEHGLVKINKYNNINDKAHEEKRKEKLVSFLYYLKYHDKE